MRILFTVSHFNDRTGGQLFTQELALALRKRGHEIQIYSPHCGPLAEQTRAAGVSVVDRIECLIEPDVIHGQHAHTLPDILTVFPNSPAVFVVHSATLALDDPTFLPRISHYIAVDDLCRARIERNREIPRASIRTILNFVDLDRYLPRAALPAKPRRALIFSNNANRSTHLPAIREACRTRNLDVDVVGSGVNNVSDNPGGLLPNYDLVFAKARCALEAMAVGTAVIVCDLHGLGQMVDDANFNKMRRLNFGHGVLTNPLLPEIIAAEIDKYDSAGAARISQRIREEADLNLAAAQWLALYSESIQQFRPHEIDRKSETTALVRLQQKRKSYQRVAMLKAQIRRLKAVPGAGEFYKWLSATWQRSLVRRDRRAAKKAKRS